jgi:uncharacterized protein
MKRGLKGRLLRAASLALFVSAGAMPLAHGASFHCSAKASASERIVCGDPVLSAQDDRLDAAYRQAADATADRRALDADRVHQWQWRQRNCTDRACVTSWYERRIAELEADRRQGQQEAAGRVKAGVVKQKLSPEAQTAVLQLKGIASDAVPERASVPRVGAREHAAVVALPNVANAIAQTDTTHAQPPQPLCIGECARRQLRIAF